MAPWKQFVLVFASLCLAAVAASGLGHPGIALGLGSAALVLWAVGARSWLRR